MKLRWSCHAVPRLEDAGFLHSSRELACVMVSCGLAQNLGALRALVVEGIQAGHMALHARSVSLSAGADVSEVDELVERLKASGEIKVRRARQLLAEMRGHLSRHEESDLSSPL
ncbi:MAG: hypothetical protein V3T72_04280 [Thermoanaerobaculia bacterium]